VLEYQDEFEKLVHGALLYITTFDDMFFVTFFMGVLKEDIRATIMLRRPCDVDIASPLALIQEQELDQGHIRSSRRDFTRGNAKVPVQPEKTKI